MDKKREKKKGKGEKEEGMSIKQKLVPDRDRNLFARTLSKTSRRV